MIKKLLKGWRVHLLTFSSDCINVFLQLYKISPAVILKLSFDFTEMASPQRNYSEPSLSKRRAFAVAMTSLRQLVEFKGAVQIIPSCGSDNPLMRLASAEQTVQKIPKSKSPLSPLPQLHFWCRLILICLKYLYFCLIFRYFTCWLIFFLILYWNLLINYYICSDFRGKVRTLWNSLHLINY